MLSKYKWSLVKDEIIWSNIKWSYSLCDEIYLKLGWSNQRCNGSKEVSIVYHQSSIDRI